MKINVRYFFCALAALTIGAMAPALCDTLAGTWSIAPSKTAGEVRLEFQMSGPTYHSNSSTDVPLSTLGLTQDQLNGSGQRVHFTLTREAGAFDCTGWAADGSAGGPDTFTPNPDFLTKMRALGYDDISPEKQVTAAVIDLTTAYTNDVAAAGYPRLELGQLIAFRALQIDAAFIRSMRSTFSNTTIDSGEMISLRALHITTDYVNQMRNAGMTVDSPHDAVTLMALHVDQAYVTELAGAGYTHLTSHELIEMRALHIDAAFIAKVRAHGLGHPSVEELIKLKAMNIV